MTKDFACTVFSAPTVHPGLRCRCAWFAREVAVAVLIEFLYVRHVFDPPVYRAHMDDTAPSTYGGSRARRVVLEVDRTSAARLPGCARLGRFPENHRRVWPPSSASRRVRPLHVSDLGHLGSLPLRPAGKQSWVLDGGRSTSSYSA